MKQLLWLMALCGSMFAANMSHEEAVVRQTYAKVAYANDVYNIHQQIDHYDLSGAQINVAQALSEVSLHHVSFLLGDFKVGNIPDIKGSYGDYVSQPDGNRVLEVTPDAWSVTVNGKTIDGVRAQIQWNQGQLHTVDWKFPAVDRLTKPIEGTIYQRFAAYQVIVDFDGQEREYHALALFALGQQEQEKVEKVFFADLITGNSALDFFVNADVTPKTLTQTPLARNPIAEAWLRKNSQPPSTPQ
ncbi:MAG TPA: hypothetical protein VFQ00_13430 [Terriglobales bacterium]|nr:hypothetical protein [Terriglobales bacterium]